MNIAAYCRVSTDTALGIGGGPINVALIIFLFSYDTKTVAACSIITILFAQISKLCSVALGTVRPFGGALYGGEGHRRGIPRRGAE